MEKLSAAGVVEEYLDQWGRSGLPDNMPEPMLVDNGPLVELNLIAVYASFQGKGYASQALRMLTALCDANDVAVEVVARPMDPSLGFAPNCPAGLSTDQLVAWYERHGFVETGVPRDDTRTMLRKPRAHLSS